MIAFELMRGRGVTLRPIQERRDAAVLYDWRNDVNTLHLWSLSRNLVGEAQFETEFLSKMEQHFHCFCMIDRNAPDIESPVGMCYSYDACMLDGHAFLCTYLVPEITGLGIGVEAAALFVQYLFAYFPFRKLYVDVFDYNDLSLRTCLSAGFEIEGTFKQHRYLDGQYWDQHRLALYRGDWERLAEKLRRRLVPSG